jgi:shikimate dehydrogenase
MKKIQNYRNSIDKIDKKKQRNLEKRFSIVQNIKTIKLKNNLPTLNDEREKQIMSNIKKNLKNKEDLNFFNNIYDTILTQSRRYQVKRCALLGENVSSSYSPAIYSYLSNKYKLDFTYDSFNVKSGYEFYDLLTKLKKGKYDALNITNPFKKYAFLINDECDGSSRVSQSSNIVLREDGKYKCFNTDYYGFEKVMERYNVDLIKSNVLILGNGATASTIYNYVLSKTLNVVVCMRRNTQHDKKFINTIYYDELESLDNYNLVINATSVHKVVDFKDSDHFTYFNLNYKEIEEYPKGIIYISGIDLLIEQAILNMQIFFKNSDIDLTESEKLELVAQFQRSLNE